MKARDLSFCVAERRDISKFIETYHYSQNINGCKYSVGFKAVYNNKIVGAMFFGEMSTTAWKKFGKTEKSVLELRRLVLVDECPRNSESRFIGFSLRHIKKTMPLVNVIVSYADPNHGHTGIIYKASNFKYLGESQKDVGYKDKQTGKIYHSRALRTKYKGEYKPFVKKLRQKLSDKLLEKIPLMGKHCFVYELRR